MSTDLTHAVIAGRRLHALGTATIGLGILFVASFVALTIGVIPARAVPNGGAVQIAGIGAPVVPSVRTATGPDQTSGQEITRYDVTGTLAADGTMRVALDFDFDFGNEPGHGPYLTLPTRVSDYDDEHDRAFEYTDVTAASSTGAPARLDVSDDGNALVLRIGDPDVGDVSGVQSYQVEYTVDGYLNPANTQHSGDELYWNVIGSGWEIPVGGVTVLVTGPAAVEGAVCFAGPAGSTTPCTSATFDGDAATFTQTTVPVGEQLTAATGWPAGTFPGVEPILVPKPDPLAPVAPASVPGIAGVLVLATGAVLLGRRVRRNGRDRAYLGLTPGLRPADSQPGLTGYRDKRTPVTVQFQPPSGVRPGELGTLVDERADPVDVTATLVDLAVRGYLRIEEVPRDNPKKKAKDWTLVQVLPAPVGGLLPFESRLLNDLFDGRAAVRLSDLKTTFAKSMAQVQAALYEHVTDVGWFRANPKTVRTRWQGLGIGLVVVGGIGTAMAVTNLPDVRGLALLPGALVLLGVLAVVLSQAAPARTEDGTAVLAQALGFRRYLATAEANQIRFEEGQDVFSRYLPYAIVFGLADRWARVFADLAAQGRTTAQPGWYVGGYYPGSNVYWVTAFAGSVDRFGAIATESLSAPTPGSSGGSGFSGGSSGGGVGGGGGGGW